MRRSLWSFAVVGLFLVSVPGFAQTTTVPVIRHPATGAFFISEVYPVIPQGYDDTGGGNPDNISDNSCFNGSAQTTPNVTVTPGIFCLGPTTNFRIDVNRFATCPSGYGSPYVQSFRLTKTVPGSQKVPNCYPPQQYIQFGAAGIRTWWALKYTQPGTTFCLEVTVRCLRNGSRRGLPEIHMDKWVWQVGVELATLPMVIDMLHSSALSVMEFPCIADERVYRDLMTLARQLREAASLSDPTQRQMQGRNAIMNLEWYILTECVWVDFVAPEFARGDGFGFLRPPGNLPSGTDWTPFDDGADGGIIDSLENPCCCKLMVDVEYISNNLGFTDGF